ncbi:hypothetical protein Bca52824_020142 [Brassica carinata]|uniref:FAF domain-containing protein n=1 Tax=Brassica carinata TaxID=52824 RepID=A0A8X8AZB2_BRACI|nr:hypothetical protein Bca52824_020142 [Brassica carinata]
MSFYKRSIRSFPGQTNTKRMPFHDNEIIGSLETTRDLCGTSTAEEEANGLMLCTEYLGFESYDMKMSQNEVEKKMTCHAEEETERVERKRRKTTEEQNVVAPVREGKKQFPPPLSSLNVRGQRSFYLQPMRKDGRLELTRVMIDRPEIFHVSRENGRLRLHLINGTTRKSCDGTLRGEITVDNPVKACCDHKGPTRLRLEHGRGDQVVDLSMINDDTGAGSMRYKSNKDGSLNSDNDTKHDAREWMYRNCYTSGNHEENDDRSGNHEENDYHHHIHLYHHYYGSKDSTYLWSRSCVKTR